MTNNLQKSRWFFVYIFCFLLIASGCRKKNDQDVFLSIDGFEVLEEKLYRQGDTLEFSLAVSSNVNVEDLVVSLMTDNGGNPRSVSSERFIQKIRNPQVDSEFVIPDIEAYDVSDFFLRANVTAGGETRSLDIPLQVALPNNAIYMAFRKSGDFWRCYNLRGDSLAFSISNRHENADCFAVNERRQELLMFDDAVGGYDLYDMLTGTRIKVFPGFEPTLPKKVTYDLQTDSYLILYNNFWLNINERGNQLGKSVSFPNGITPTRILGNGVYILVCATSALSGESGVYVFNYQGSQVGFVPESGNMIPFLQGGELFIAANRTGKTVVYKISGASKGNEVNVSKEIRQVYVDRTTKTVSFSTDNGIYVLIPSSGQISPVMAGENITSFVAVDTENLIDFTTPEGVFSGRFGSANLPQKRNIPVCIKIGYSL